MPAIARTMYTTFLASSFRSIRFGVNEAHGRGIAIQLNYLPRRGRVQGAARRHVRAWTTRRSRDAVTALTRDIMTLQAEGNYAKAKALIEQLGVVRPEVQKVLDRLTARARRHRAEVHDRRDARALTTADGDVRPVADDPVDAPVEQPRHVRRLVHGPDLHGDAGSVRVLDEPPASRRSSRPLVPGTWNS